MATPIELAIVELQVVIRALHRRIGEMERRLGISPEEFPQRGHREVQSYTPLSAEKRVPSVQRTAASTTDPYDIASTHVVGIAHTATASPPLPQTPAPTDNTLQVNLSSSPPPAAVPLAPASPSITPGAAIVPADTNAV
ncbi:MAG TPA: hypothetical protein VGN88_11785, partial [Phycisphaerae bacterium]